MADNDFTPLKINPISDPSWWHWSKGISQPKADESRKDLIEGIGGTAESAVKTADFIHKSSEEDKLHAQVDPEQKNFIDALNLKNASVTAPGETPSLAGVGMGQGVGTRQVSQFGYGVQVQPGQAASPDKQAPISIQQLPNQISRLEGARKNGTISETPYYARLWSILQNARSQNPGYRDFIDQTVEKITGVNPANAYIKSLIGDINSKINEQSADKQKAMALAEWAFKEGYGDEAVKRVASGQWGISEVAGYANPLVIRKHQIEEADRVYGLAERSRKWEAETAGEAVRTIASNVDANFWHTARSMGGITPKAVEDIITESASGGKVPEKADSEKLATLIKSQSEQYAQAVRQQTQKYSKHVPQEQIEKEIAEHQKKYEAVYNAIKKDDYGLAAYHINQDKARADDTAHRFYTSPIGQALTNINAAGKIDPEFVKKLVAHYAGTDFEPKLKGLLSEMEVEAQTQPGINQTGDIRKTGQVVTMKDQIQALKEKGIVPPDHPAFDDFVRRVDNLTSPNTNEKTKLSFAQYFFDPKNQDVLNEYNKEGLRQAGKHGQFYVYHRLTAPDVADSMFELGKSYPEVWQNYKEFAQYVFSTNLAPSLLTMNTPSGYNLKFDDKTSHFDIVDDKGMPVRPKVVAGQSFPPLELKAGVDRFNAGMNPLHYIASKDPTFDANEYMARLLLQSNIDPSQTHIVNLNSHMLEAFKAAKLKQETEKAGESAKRKLWQGPSE